MNVYLRCATLGAIVALIVSLGTLVAVSVMMMQGPQKRAGKPADGVDPVASDGEEPLKQGYVRIGGVQRPETDINGRYDKNAITIAEDHALNLGYGATPLVKSDANPQAASVAEALATKTHPERLSPAILPDPFDEAQYKANPQAYVNTIEHGI